MNMKLSEIDNFNEKPNELFFPLILTENDENIHTVFFLATRKVRFGKYSRLAIFSKFKNNRVKLLEIVSGESKAFPIEKVK